MLSLLILQSALAAPVADTLTITDVLFTGPSTAASDRLEQALSDDGAAFSSRELDTDTTLSLINTIAMEKGFRIDDALTGSMRFKAGSEMPGKIAFKAGSELDTKDDGSEFALLDVIDLGVDLVAADADMALVPDAYGARVWIGSSELRSGALVHGFLSDGTEVLVALPLGD